jgi:hypothetical protein
MGPLALAVAVRALGRSGCYPLPAKPIGHAHQRPARVRRTSQGLLVTSVAPTTYAAVGSDWPLRPQAADRLAARLSISQQTVQQWRRIPAERVIEVQAVTGVPRERLRRDLYRPRRLKEKRA